MEVVVPVAVDRLTVAADRLRGSGHDYGGGGQATVVVDIIMVAVTITVVDIIMVTAIMVATIMAIAITMVPVMAIGGDRGVTTRATIRATTLITIHPTTLTHPQS